MKTARISTVVCLLVLLLVTGLPFYSAQAKLEDELSLEEVATPTELEELIAKFARLDYSMIHFDDEGNVTLDIQLNYSYEGQEEVQGVQTDKIAIRGSEEIDPMDFWIDNNKLVQVKVDGQVIPEQMLGMIEGQLSRTVFFPFAFYDQLNLEALDKIGDMQISESVGMVGEKEVDIIEIVIQNPIAEAGLESGNIIFAWIGDILMLSEYDLISDDGEHKFSVDTVEVR